MDVDMRRIHWVIVKAHAKSLYQQSFAPAFSGLGSDFVAYVNLTFN